MSKEASGQKSGAVSKIGRLTSDRKRGRKKDKGPPPEIDIMSIISSDDEPVKKPES
jgi:hypothetical protein